MYLLVLLEYRLVSWRDGFFSLTYFFVVRCHVAYIIYVLVPSSNYERL